MNSMDPIWTVVLLPLGLGLLGFVEPCSVGSSMLFVRFVEGQPPSVRVAQAVIFAAVRALFIGGLGAAAAVVGAAFVGFQRTGWVVLGVLYLALGLTYLTGKAKMFMRTLGPRLGRLTPKRGAASLAVLFGLNVPACAAPLLAALLGSATVGGAAQVGRGFVMLAVFGLALSLPLVAALVWSPARRLLDQLVARSTRVPILIGGIFAVLGLWSIYFGLFARV